MSVIRNIPVEDVVPNPEQPRVEFDHAEIESLAQSIQAHGLIQPIVVEEAQDGYVLRLRKKKSLLLQFLKSRDLRTVLTQGT